MSPGLSHMYLFYNKANFYGEEFLAPCSTPNLEDHSLSAVHDILFHIFTAVIHIEVHSYICNLRMCHAMVTRTMDNSTCKFIKYTVMQKHNQ